ncbi:hypothetical protein EJ04DRAFT_423631 [Polyplosphaeria fusca]|uniref:Required for respiratory growth protein 9, mitochondrial n=1 Tax=Polyplosphaeria fusca TaxID=682080 RepID=A0A9P4R8K7_9PLEO|nr:hypothetical protein EJ04DRAFT_423631 [Polyplosphaeria fusca]
MTCNSCAQKALSLFVRSFITADALFSRRTAAHSQTARFFSTSPRSRDQEQPSRTPFLPPKSHAKAKPLPPIPARREKSERWQIDKAAVKEKLGGEAWNPRKKLSPDTMEGIRHLHQTAPHRFTTSILAQYFKVSPEAIRRILKSKWRPSDEEQEERIRRWDQRGERIWSNLVELGVKPPKRWREMGVGKAERGSVPKWKGKRRNTVAVQDSFNEDIIPVVEKDGTRSTPEHITPLFERLV